MMPRRALHRFGAVLVVFSAAWFMPFSFASPTGHTGAIRGSISGIWGDAIADAHIRLLDTKFGTQSDSSGQYRILGIKPGSYTMAVSKSSFRQAIRYSVVIRPASEVVADFGLEREDYRLDRVVVRSGGRARRKIRGGSHHAMDAHQIENQPAGAYDLQRALSTLPSFAGGFDESNDIIVIGGNYGENLFRIDGIEVFNPNHFSNPTGSGGVLSVVHPSLVRKMDFYAGAFPARYGQKASSVLELSLREGAQDRTHGKADVGIAGYGGTIEGPVGANKYLFTAHRSFTNLIYKILDNELTIPPTYTSGIGKVSLDLGDRQSLSLLGLAADDYSGERGPTWLWEYKGQQQMVGIVHKVRLTPSSILRSNGSFVRQGITTNDRNNEGTHRSHNEQVQSAADLRSGLSATLPGSIVLETGGAARSLDFDHHRWYLPDTIWLYDTVADTAVSILRINPALVYDEDRQFETVSAYLQASVPFADLFTFNLGGRADYYEYTREKTYSPRLSGTVRLPARTEWTLAYGRHYQPPDCYDLFRHPNNANLKSKCADHMLTGLSCKYLSDWEIRLEGFYRAFRDVPISKAQLTPDPLDWDQEYVNGGKSRTVGGDLFVEKKLKKNYWGSFSYSYAVSKWFDPRDMETLFDADLDYRHHLSLLAGYRNRYRLKPWFKRWNESAIYRITKYLPLLPTDETDYSVRWRYLGGRPHTPRQYSKRIRRWTIDSTAEYNSARMTPYSRLDFHLKERIFQGKVSIWTYLEAMNILDHDNLFWYLYRDDTAEVVERYQIPRVVLGGIMVEF